MLKYDSGNKSINIDGDPDDNSRASAIIIFQQSAYINLKIETLTAIRTPPPFRLNFKGFD